MRRNVRININLAGAKPSLAFPEESADPKEQHDRESKVGLEEALYVADAINANGRESSVELEDHQ